MTNLMEQKPQKRFIGLTGNMWLYALGLMGINFAIGLVNSFQAEFFNKILEANLVAIAVIILVAKFVSIVADFVIGNLIDRANFKSGKMRPWILMSAFPLAVLTTLSFVFIPFGHSTGGEVGKYIYITVIMILWNISMTMADIPVQGSLSFVANNSNDTNNAAGMANTLRSISLASPGIFIMILGMLVGDGNDGVSWLTYLITAIVMSVLGLAFQLWMYFKGKEQYQSTASSGMSFKEMFRELKSNKMILIVFLTYMLGFGRNIGMGLAVQATCIFVREGINMSFIGINEIWYGDQLSFVIGLTSAVSSMVTILLNPVINKKLGEKRYFIIAGLYGFAVSLIGFIMYVCGGTALRSLWAILVYQFFLGFAYGPNGYLPMVMTADIVDYQEWKTGKRTEGTQFAIMSMSNKLSNALSVSLGLLLIGAIGYSSDKYFSTPVTEIATYVTNDMQNRAWAIYFLIPGLCMLASSIVMFFYKIDAKTKKLMREELALRHAADGQDETDGNDEGSNDGNDEGLNDGVERVFVETSLGAEELSPIDTLSRGEAAVEAAEESLEAEEPEVSETEE